MSKRGKTEYECKCECVIKGKGKEKKMIVRFHRIVTMTIAVIATNRAPAHIDLIAAMLSVSPSLLLHICPLSPASAWALRQMIEALHAQGHNSEVVDL